MLIHIIMSSFSHRCYTNLQNRLHCKDIITPRVCPQMYEFISISQLHIGQPIRLSNSCNGQNSKQVSRVPNELIEFSTLLICWTNSHSYVMTTTQCFSGNWSSVIIALRFSKHSLMYRKPQASFEIQTNLSTSYSFVSCFNCSAVHSCTHFIHKKSLHRPTTYIFTIRQNALHIENMFVSNRIQVQFINLTQAVCISLATYNTTNQFSLRSDDVCSCIAFVTCMIHNNGPCIVMQQHSRDEQIYSSMKYKLIIFAALQYKNIIKITANIAGSLENRLNDRGWASPFNQSQWLLGVFVQ